MLGCVCVVRLEKREGKTKLEGKEYRHDLPVRHRKKGAKGKILVQVLSMSELHFFSPVPQKSCGAQMIENALKMHFSQKYRAFEQGTIYKRRLS